MHGWQVQRAQAKLAEEAAAAGQSGSIGDAAVAEHLKLKNADAVQQRLANAEDAKDLMVQFNMRLVLSIAKKYVGRCGALLLCSAGLVPVAVLLCEYCTLAITLLALQTRNSLLTQASLCRGVDFGDLIPEGVIGLMRAVDRFDASKGFKFSTYAHWWIRQAVSRCISEHSRVVRLPVHVYDHLAKINKVARSLNRQPDRQEPATYAEIGERSCLIVCSF